MQKELIEKTLAALEKHSFQTARFSTVEQAVEWLDQQIPQGASVGVGGSVSVRSSGLLERLSARGIEILDHWQEGLSPEEKKELFFRTHRADAYFCSANAITAEGHILNVDGMGNRLAAHCYGPKRLYLLCGINKLVPDMDAALERIEKIAPINCKRKGFDTPCTETGECCDCNTPDRSCRAYLVLRRPTRAVPVTVVFVEQEMGM
ncbi:MAG: lactate utilization protein [Bacillota bacterium]|nr:lactate utilization protein [Bacillota bacterium]